MKDNKYIYGLDKVLMEQKLREHGVLAKELSPEGQPREMLDYGEYLVKGNDIVLLSYSQSRRFSKIDKIKIIKKEGNNYHTEIDVNGKKKEVKLIKMWNLSYPQRFFSAKLAFTKSFLFLCDSYH